MPLSPDQLQAALDTVDSCLDESLERLNALLRIPSISTNAAYAADCGRAADWLAAELTALGFEASVRSTAGHPMVVGHQRGTADPNVLFYGHYDVQPVDPLELWKTGPFEPQLVDTPNGKVIAARGASDDKGQLMTFLEACRALKNATGELPVGVSVLFEGEEECGSPSMEAFVAGNISELAADIALICDTDMRDGVPAITTMLRGLVAEEIEITCASRDLHSGGYGNAAHNPNQVLADLISSLRNPDGSVTIEGFYDDVRELPAEVAEMWKTLDFNGEAYLREVGLSVPAGEAGRSVLEQIAARPSCEINGISGGYTGEGFKTVIPAKAKAKISFRLVADQDPVKIRDAFRSHIRKRLPADCTVEFREHGTVPAASVSIDNPFMVPARHALTDEWGKPAVLVGSGGTIPLVGTLKRQLGMDSLLIGFAQDDDNIHSPNEKYDLKSFHKGIRSWVRVLAALGS